MNRAGRGTPRRARRYHPFPHIKEAIGGCIGALEEDHLLIRPEKSEAEILGV